MATTNTFGPKSRQFNERQITRNQQDFSGGMFRDIPKVPNNGVADLVNYVDRGDYIEGRGGTRLWGNYDTGVGAATLPTIRSGYTWVKNGYTLTRLGGTGDDFTDADVGNWIVHDTGIHERISALVDINNVTTDTDDTATGAMSTNGSIRGAINGTYFHKTKKKFVLQIGTKLYITDPTMASWTQCYCLSTEDFSSTISTFDEFQDYLFITNINGIFKVDLATTPYYYFKINTPVPTVRLDNTVPTNSVYMRHYVYTMVRLSGSGTRDRATSGIYIEQESGSNTFGSDFIDYGIQGNLNIVDTGNGHDVGLLTNPINTLALNQRQKHWTHYGLYATLDVGDLGYSTSGEGNDPELYIWVADVPIAKSFRISMVNTTVTAEKGTFVASDVGSVMDINGSNYTITAYTSPSIVEVTPANNSLIGYFRASIGAYTNFVATQSGYTVTATTNAFGTDDVGRTIIWSDGTYSVISAVGGAITDTVTVLDSTTRTSFGGCFDPTSRRYTDITTDDTLKGRIAAGLTLNQRFWEALPQADIGITVPGFLITAERGKGIVNYSQMPQGFEYITGYYYSPFQYIVIKDDIQAFTEHTDKVVVWGKNSRTELPYNSIIDKEIENIGISYSVIGGQALIDSVIGIYDYGAICQIDQNRVFFITNEPGIRIYDGSQDGPNLATGKIINDLKTWKYGYTISYHPLEGVIFWGLDG